MKIIQINPKAFLPLGVTQQPPHPAELGEQRGPARSQDSLPRSFQDIFDLIIIPILLRDPRPLKGFLGEDSEPSPRMPLPRAARPAAFTSLRSSPALLGSIPSPGPARSGWALSSPLSAPWGWAGGCGAARPGLPARCTAETSAEGKGLHGSLCGVFSTCPKSPPSLQGPILLPLPLRNWAVRAVRSLLSNPLFRAVLNSSSRK